jgi:hypothetical protein
MMSEKTASVIRWVAVTAGGALIGAVVTSIYQSARPSVSIIDIQPSVVANKQFVKDDTPVPVPASLQTMTEESAWVDSMRGSTMPYGDFETALDNGEHRLNDYFEGWNRLKTNLPRLRELLERGGQASEDEKIEFYDLWERNRWVHLWLASRRVPKRIVGPAAQAPCRRSLLSTLSGGPA